MFLFYINLIFVIEMLQFKLLVIVYTRCGVCLQENKCPEKSSKMPVCQKNAPKCNYPANYGCF